MVSGGAAGRRGAVTALRGILTEQVDQLHVLFNNCCGDAAVRSAETMTRLLGLSATAAAEP
ncbi:hypothetical protein GCM10009535_43640 [Streptomyces thermocarboxydovorans]|uniref:Uncharacterized protein n=1 Tax=Streptomyces thermocarboxydovorans TaxID=59298 RepID=A0ABN1HMX9_9ACTN